MLVGVCTQLKAGVGSQLLLRNNICSSHFLSIYQVLAELPFQREGNRDLDKVTTPRSHSQEGSGPPRGFTPRLPISIAFTWPPPVFSPHSSQPVAEPDHPRPSPEVRAQGQVPCPAGLGQTGASALHRPCGRRGPAVRPPRAPRLCGSLESRRVRGRSPGSCKVRRGRSLAWTSQLFGERGPTCTHATDGRTKPKPSSRGLQNFPPPCAA